MAATAGIVVPTGAIRYGNQHIALKRVAEGAITPGNLVKKGTADYLVVVNTAGAYPSGVADLNYKAREDNNDPLTHAFAAGEECMVIIHGMVRVVADTSAFTAGDRVMAGDTDGAEVEDQDATAPSAADTYATADFTAIIGGLRTSIGFGLTSAATTVAGVIMLTLC